MDQNQFNQAKGYFWVVLDVLLVMMFLNLVFFVMPTIKRLGDSFVNPRTVTVSAQGKTIVSPDIAETSVSIVSRGIDPEKLATDNNDKMLNIVDFLKARGVESKDIKTTGYNLYPDYKYDPNTQESHITGYTLTQTVTVKIRDLNKVAEIVGGLTPLGVNQIGGINFSVDEPEKYLAVARADAFAKAQAKAAQMAAMSGVSLGRVVNVAEGQNYPIPYYTMNAGMAAKSADAGPVPAPTIEPGSQEVTLQVSLTYELR